MTPGYWKGRRVFVTGHTGFKGAWLAHWLARMGAEVTGYAREAETEPSLWTLLGGGKVRSVIGDLTDEKRLRAALDESRPHAIFHLAAQALVRRSYRDPVETYASNVLGTVTLMQAARDCADLAAIVIATSDKAYENVEQVWGYREVDALGGRDPYSGSKGAADIAASSMARSFFAPLAEGGHKARVGIARAGNVIGGGDWSEDRLVPDIVRGCLGPSRGVTLRAPKSVRPWQHVLEPLRGYLMLAERLAGDDKAAGAWNFGPDRRDERAVIEVAEAVVAALGQGRVEIDPAGDGTLHEAKMLRLDCTKARLGLGWQPALAFEDCVRLTAGWYAGWASGKTARSLCDQQIVEYEGLVFNE